MNKRYNVTVVDSMKPAGERVIVDFNCDDVMPSEVREVTALYKAGDKVPYELAPSAVTVLTVKATSIDPDTNPSGSHTMLYPKESPGSG